MIVLAMALRIAIAFISWGSNDATTWEQRAFKINQLGLLAVYAIDRDFNHPPLTGYWAAIAYRMTHASGERPAPSAARHIGWNFPFAFKQIDVLADAMVCWLLWRILRPRFGATFAIFAAALFAWSPDSILLTAHHCNVDPCYAMFCLLSVYLIEDRKQDFWGGIALGAAINVKLLPVLLILPLVLTYYDWGRARRFVLGLSIGVIPFIPVLVFQPVAFYHNALLYGSMKTYWGVNEFLLETEREPRFSAVTQALIDRYYDMGRYVVLACLLLLALRARRTRTMNCYTLAACAAGVFLIVTPGFGMQYTILALPLMLATGRLLSATIYGLCTGLMLLFTYWQQWPGGFPMDSYALVGPRAPGPLFGLLAWATLVVFVFTKLRDPAPLEVPHAR